jgi:DNA mismatch endonuclease, patch repair protein
MTDVHTKETRSYNMSRIRNKDTKPEFIVRKFLHSCGFRYRLHLKDLPGRPDIVLPKFKSVIFINGCFWHGHEDCKYFVVPKTHTEWWLQKISKNKVHDKEILLKLKHNGWNVFTIFECELKSSRKEETLLKIVSQLGNIKNVLNIE